MSEVDLKESYQKLRKIKLYGTKDKLDEVIPREDIRREVSDFIELIKYLEGDRILITLELSFFQKDPVTKKRLLFADHRLSYGRKIIEQCKAKNLGLSLELPPSIRNEHKIICKGEVYVRGEKSSDKFLRQLQVMLFENDEIDFGHKIQIKISLKDREEIPIITLGYFSRKIEHLLSSKEKRVFQRKEIYKEAYTPRDMLDIGYWYERIGDIIAEQCRDKEISIRCFRAGFKRADRLLAMKSLGFEDYFESYIRRPKEKINDKNDIIAICKRYLAYEFIPCNHPKDLISMKKEDFEEFPFHVVIDFDNRTEYSNFKEDVNIITKEILKYMKGARLCGTGTNSHGAHLHIFLTYPEPFVAPAKTQTFEEWNKLPYGRKLLHSLEAYFNSLLAYIIAKEDLNVGLNHLNHLESPCEAIAEVSSRHRTGVKATGSLNSSRKYGVKNFLENNLMPNRKEDYEWQTSTYNFLKNIEKIREEVKFKEAKKYASENLSELKENFSPQIAQTVYELYQKLSVRNIPSIVRWAIRKNI